MLPGDLCDVGFANYQLLVVGFALLALVIEVTETAREVQAAIDPSVRDLTACIRNPLLFAFILGFMIIRQRHCMALSAQNRPGVPSIRSDNFGRSDQHHTGSTSRSKRNSIVIETSSIRFFPYYL